MFFSSLKMSKQKKPWEIAAFFRRKDETSHLLRASVVVSSAERSRRRLKVTRPNSRVPFITHFQYRWFLGAKAEMSISVSGYLGEAIFRPLPTIPSEKIGGVSEIFYIFTPKTWRKMSNLTIIFCRWVGEKFNHQRPKTLRQKTTLAMRPTSQAITGRMSMMTWKQVVWGDDGMNLDLLKKLILTTGSMEKWYICQHFLVDFYYHGTFLPWCDEIGNGVRSFFRDVT